MNNEKKTEETHSANVPCKPSVTFCSLFLKQKSVSFWMVYLQVLCNIFLIPGFCYSCTESLYFNNSLWILSGVKLTLLSFVFVALKHLFNYCKEQLIWFNYSDLIYFVTRGICIIQMLTVTFWKSLLLIIFGISIIRVRTALVLERYYDENFSICISFLNISNLFFLSILLKIDVEAE